MFMESCLNIVGRRRRRRNRRSWFKEWKVLLSLLIFFLFFFLCFCATYISCHNPHILSVSILTKEADGTFYKNLRNKAKVNNEITMMIGGVRKVLGGVGSSPPRCISKCDGCMPCKPVRVAVPPRMPVTTEYYPETWRCKCGIKFYLP